MAVETKSLNGVLNSAVLSQRQVKEMRVEPPLNPKDSSEGIAEAASQFEALLLHQMFQAMWKTVPSEGSLLGSDEEQYYRDMFNEALAQSVSKDGGIGIKDVIVKDMERLSKKTKP